jgi:hypothetical protein
MEQQIIRQIADEQHWDNPLQIFIEPSHLKSALNFKRFEKSHSLIESLLEKLFDFDIKNDLQLETQAINHSSTLSTTIILGKEEPINNELSGIESA